MGTSSSFTGPTGRNPLLPDNYQADGTQSSPETQVKDTINIEKWRIAKANFSKYISGTSSNMDASSSSYVRAYGGGKSAGIQAIGGKSTAIKLGGFLSSISSSGFSETFKQLGIDFEGKSTEEVLSALVEKLSSSQNTKEDAVATEALMDSIEVLYEECDMENSGLEELDDLNSDTFSIIMEKFIGSYIFHKYLKDLESRFEDIVDSAKTIEMENDIKDYIFGKVEIALESHNLSGLNFTSEEVTKQIESIYSDCYEVIEGVMK